jgi:hypothetical protein
MSVLDVKRGDTATFTIALTDSAGAPLDLTGLIMTFTAKYHLMDPDDDAVITKSDIDGIVVDYDPTTGIAVLTIDPEDTATLPPIRTRLFWDLQVDNGAGDVRTPLTGTLNINADVTGGVLS